MTIDYTKEFGGFVEDLIIEFGQTATLVVLDNSSYSPASGGMTRATSNHTINLVSQEARETFVSGKLVKDDRKTFLISPKDMTVVPKTGDKILVNGETLVIDDVSETKPATVAVLYEVKIKI